MSIYLGGNLIAGSGNGKADVDLCNVNASGTALASGWSMPSSRYIDLTLGASGSRYTAPANGWMTLAIRLNAETSSSSPYVGIYNDSKPYIGLVSGAVFAGASWKNVSVPCCRGDSIRITYSGKTSDDAILRFRYAEGENV